jgi:hypothetical protein
VFRNTFSTAENTKSRGAGAGSHGQQAMDGLSDIQRDAMHAAEAVRIDNEGPPATTLLPNDDLVAATERALSSATSTKVPFSFFSLFC